MSFTGFWREPAMCQPQSCPSAFQRQIDFHATRSGRHVISASFKAPREDHPGVRHDLEIFAPNYVPAVGVHTIDPASLRIDLRSNSHPAEHLLGVGKKLEDHRRRRIDVDFFDDRIRGHVCQSLPPLPPTSAWPAFHPRMSRENSAIEQTPRDGFDKAGSYLVCVR